MMITAFGYATAYNFFQTWLHTFLVKGRGFTDANLALSSLPYFAAIATTLLGGFASDFLVRRLGVKWGRRSLGIFGLTCAGASTLALTFTHHPLLTIAFLALIYGSITFQQAGMFGTTLDIGHQYAGALTGLMNTAAQVGGLFSTVAFGYVVSYFRSYDAPFYPIAALLFVGAFLWLKIDASRPL
jgi:MFS family permease